MNNEIITNIKHQNIFFMILDHYRGFTVTTIRHLVQKRETEIKKKKNPEREARQNGLKSKY